MKESVGELLTRIKTFGIEIQRAWFLPKSSYLSDWIGFIWLPMLYLVGLFQWANFLAWGKIDFRIGDWYNLAGPQLALITDSVKNWQLPLHSADPIGMKGVTDRILSVPEFFLSPQFILLRFIEPGTFVLINSLLFFTLGYLGLLLLRKKMGISYAAFTILFILFNFNGHITTHLAAGHITWMGYFLLPYFLLLVLEIPADQIKWQWIICVSLLNVLMFMQGSFHIFVWCLIFQGFIGLYQKRYRNISFLAILFSLLLNMYRILPAILEAGDLKSSFITGFLNVEELLSSLVKLVQPADALILTGNKLTHYVAWWEVDHYIGWIGFIFTIGFGCVFWFVEKKTLKNPYGYLYTSIFSMVVLSIGRIYNVVFLLQIPLLSAERIPSRFLIIPLLFLFVLAAIGLQNYFNKHKITATAQLIYLGLLLVLISDLQQHFELWYLSNTNEAFLPGVQVAVFSTIRNHNDPVYIWSIMIGTAVMVITLVYLIIRVYQERKS